MYKNNGQDYTGFGFEIGGHDIIPLYDVPHLLKNLRNNLVSKDLNFEYDGKNHTASWKHTIQFYELDKRQSTEGDRLTLKLTDCHVYPATLKKMKGANAAQVFSQRVGAIMKRFAEMNKEIPIIIGLDASAQSTGQLCLFMDKLFDSANGNSIKLELGKNLRCAVTRNSSHWDFWQKALITLNSMKYINTNKAIVPSITNWIKTVKGIMHICKRLLDCGFAFVLLQNFNQDPIENFFGSIRSHGVRNIKPTPAMFISSFKALLINNFTSNHSVGSNCENDDCDGALDNLKNFLIDEIPLEETIIQSPTESMIEIEIPNVKIPSSNSQVNSGSRAYVAGWLTRMNYKKKQKTTNTVAEIINLVQSWDV
ncbi:uncharacterized protein LOC112686472 [Sipha flava]|uniref:Uncharacterized protein LOC112686472 n=1 Tax=Sipha flava TaxID=143950 RepID=A0A8B8FU93_9HEMI|nr:uncharacterized protein LOC112686472 [Sipha flava]